MPTHRREAPLPQPLRIGILGAARIAPPAVIEPARVVEGVEIAAIAARSLDRARGFARQHAIPRAWAGYEALIADPDLDAIYNPLPNALHGEWTIRALRAGKHVLCEKPLASNAAQAEEMARAAQESSRVLAEALHWRYHPLAARIREILQGGSLGPLTHVAGEFSTPSIPADDIRFDLSLGGGATMDLGCYPLHWLRFATGSEPEIVQAEATQRPSGIDVRMTAELRFPGDIAGRMHCSMEPDARLWAALDVQGKTGRLRVVNPLAPHLGHALQIEDAAGARTETVAGETTYIHQLRAFVACVRDGVPMASPLSDSLGNLRAIDGIYRAAGMAPRGI